MKDATDSRDQVGLEFVQVDIQGTIKTQRGSDGGYNLGNQPIEI